MFLEGSLLACVKIGTKEGFSAWCFETSVDMHTNSSFF